MQTQNPDGRQIEMYTAVGPSGDTFVLRHEEDDAWSLWCYHCVDRYALLNLEGNPRTFSQPDSAAGLFSTWEQYGDFAEEPELTGQWRRFVEVSKAMPWPADLDWQRGPVSAE